MYIANDFEITEDKINQWVNSLKGRATKEDITQEIYLIQLEAEAGLNKLNSPEIMDKLAYIYTALEKRFIGYSKSSLTEISLSSFNSDDESNSFIEKQFSRLYQDDAFIDSEKNQDLEDALFHLDILTNTSIESFLNIFGYDKELVTKKNENQILRMKDRAIDNLITSIAIQKGLSLDALNELKNQCNYSKKQLVKHTKKNQCQSGVKELA